jgi:hypothetical protein
MLLYNRYGNLSSSGAQKLSGVEDTHRSKQMNALRNIAAVALAIVIPVALTLVELGLV